MLLILYLMADIALPPESSRWPERLVAAWHAAGGMLTSDALRNCCNPGEGDQWLDLLGQNFPVLALPRHSAGADGALGAAFGGEGGDQFFARMAEDLATDGWSSTDMMGTETSPSLWKELCAEGDRLRPLMRPGEIMRDGKRTSGVSPSGAPRGDSFLLVRGPALTAPYDTIPPSPCAVGAYERPCIRTSSLPPPIPVDAGGPGAALPDVGGP